MKYFLVLIFILMYCVLVAQNSIAKLEDNLCRIDSSIILKEVGFSREYFPAIYFNNHINQKYLSWFNFDEKYDMGIAQNLFGTTDLAYTTSLNMVVFNRRSSELLVFVHGWDEELSCRKKINLIELLDNNIIGLVFNAQFKNIGSIFFQFNLPEAQVIYTRRKYLKGKWVECTKKIKGYSQYNMASYKILNYKGFREFCDKIFKVDERLFEKEVWSSSDQYTNNITRFFRLIEK